MQGTENFCDQLNDRSVFDYFFNVKGAVFNVLVREEVLDVNDEGKTCLIVIIAVREM